MGRETRHDTDDLYARPAPVIVPRHLRIGVAQRVTADGTEITPLDETAMLNAVHELVVDNGIAALAISFLHAYANPAHERHARELIRSLHPQLPISLSSDVEPEIGEYERTNTACVNAYVQPVVGAYLDRLDAGSGTESPRNGQVAAVGQGVRQVVAVDQRADVVSPRNIFNTAIRVRTEHNKSS